MIRVVLDTNVFVSAALATGAPDRIVRAWLAGAFDVVVCPMLLDELTAVLARRKIRRLVEPDDAAAFVAMVARHAVTVDDPDVERGVAPDPGDDYLVALVRAGRAQFLVSGDGRVLEIEIAGVGVLSCARFLDALG